MRKALVLSLATVMLLCSFSLKNLFGSKSTTEPAPAATVEEVAPVATIETDGRAAGAALRTIYANYQKDGKFDYSNLNNIISTISLINSCKSLKENGKDKAYWSDFATGLVLGSENLIKEEISGTVTSKLADMVQKVDTEKVESAVEKAAAVKTVASDMSALLSLFKD